MQVFLPHPSFAHSVACLDRARLGKQRVECGQILTALRALSTGGTVGWSTHPCVRMWRPYPGALGLYMTLCVWEWEARGYVNGMVTPFSRSLERDPAYHWWEAMPSLARDVEMPVWLGREDLHASHRGRLLDKMPEWYSRYGWTDTPQTEAEGYAWPA